MLVSLVWRTYTWEARLLYGSSGYRHDYADYDRRDGYFRWCPGLSGRNYCGIYQMTENMLLGALKRSGYLYAGHSVNGFVIAKLGLPSMIATWPCSRSVMARRQS